MGRTIQVHGRRQKTSTKNSGKPEKPRTQKDREQRRGEGPDARKALNSFKKELQLCAGREKDFQKKKGHKKYERGSLWGEAGGIRGLCTPFKKVP